MNLRVTRLSWYGDDVWDYSEEYQALRGRCTRTIRFAGVWGRNPVMRETAKAFAWARKNGTDKVRPIGWGTVRTDVMYLAVFAQALEKMGFKSFADLNADNLDAVVARFPNARYYQKMLGKVGILYSMTGLPHISGRHPFNGRKARHLIRNGGVERPTEPLPDELIGMMVRRCLDYERRLPGLLKLGRSRLWSGRLARERGIKGRRDFEREWRNTMTAGCIMILAATGMRCSELLSLEKGCLECAQADGLRWYLWGTAYKFHGVGVEARWSCSRLGRRGYHMLSRMARGGRKPLVTNPRNGATLGGYQVNRCLKRWMAAQGWRDGKGEPFVVCSHQFRPTFAQQVIRFPGMNEFALKDHFKHHDILMTDHYVGSDWAFIETLLRDHPAAAKVVFEEEMCRRIGMEDAA